MQNILPGFLRYELGNNDRDRMVNLFRLMRNLGHKANHWFDNRPVRRVDVNVTDVWEISRKLLSNFFFLGRINIKGNVHRHYLGRNGLRIVDGLSRYLR